MSGRGETQPGASIMLELTPEGWQRFEALLAGLREFSPQLDRASLLGAVFLFGIDKAELELATTRLMARGHAGNGGTLQVIK